MTNLEIMERGTSFTTGAYMKAYYSEVEKGNIDYYDLENAALAYSGNVLVKTIHSSNGMCEGYTRKGNLRYDMASIGKDGIETELLKNVVCVATYHKINDTIFGNHIGDVITPDMADDQIAVVLFNNIVNAGAKKGYELLGDPNVLSSVCRSFSRYRREGQKEVLDNIAKTNNAAMFVINELDTYYAKYGDRPKMQDNTSFGYSGK